MNILFAFIAALVVLKILSLRGRIGKKLFYTLMDQDLRIIDVRSPEEFRSFHVKGAINIPHSNIANGVKKHKISKDHPIVLYCASGARSGIALKILKSSGYTNVHNGGTVGYMNKLM